jgi:hypothetical protein
MRCRERLQPRPRRVDVGFDVADPRRGVDELLVERAPIRADGLDLALEFGLGLQDRALPGARAVEFLIALLEDIEIGLRRRARHGGNRWRGNLSGRRRRRGILGERGQVGAERQRKRQSRAEHEARIGAARSSENHRVQG